MSDSGALAQIGRARQFLAEAAPEMAAALEAPRRARRVVGLDGWEPADPVFPSLWEIDAPRKNRSRG